MSSAGPTSWAVRTRLIYGRASGFQKEIFRLAECSLGAEPLSYLCRVGRPQESCQGSGTQTAMFLASDDNPSWWLPLIRKLYVGEDRTRFVLCISLAAHKVIPWLFHCSYRRGILRSASQVFFRRRPRRKSPIGKLNAVSVLGLALDGTDLAGGSLALCPPWCGFSPAWPETPWMVTEGKRRLLRRHAGSPHLAKIAPGFEKSARNECRASRTEYTKMGRRDADLVKSPSPVSSQGLVMRVTQRKPWRLRATFCDVS